MRIDRHKINVILAQKDLRQKDIVKSGVPRGTLCSALLENRISALTAQRIADCLGVAVTDITKAEE